MDNQHRKIKGYRKLTQEESVDDLAWDSMVINYEEWNSVSIDDILKSYSDKKDVGNYER